MTHNWEQDSTTTPTQISTQPTTVEEQHITNTENTTPSHTTRYGRTIRRPQYLGMVESHTAYVNTYHPLPTDSEETHLLQPDIMAHSEPHPFALIVEQAISFIAKSDPDTMYLEEALRQPDRDEFIKAMYKELNDHIGHKHWKVVPLKSVPQYKSLYLWCGR